MASTRLTLDGPIATLAFDRPEKRNAFNEAAWREIPAQIERAVGDPAVRVIVVRGSGGNFAAGADIAEFDTVFASRESTLDYLALMSAATNAIEAAPLPVIAFVEGLCFGAGVAVALSCDVRVAASDGRFAITPAKLGLMYSLADTKRVVDAVGASKAKDLLFTGRVVDASEALSIGLVDVVADDVASKVAEMTALSSWTHARTKAVIRKLLDGQHEECDETRGWFADAIDAPDYGEGVAAFRSRRPPAFPPRKI